MNKLSPFIVASFLVTSSIAFAAGTTGATINTAEPMAQPTTAAPADGHARRGLKDVGSSFKQMGRDAKGVAHDLTHRRHHKDMAATETNTGGYAGSSTATTSDDSSRRQRMDAAYADWQKKSKS